MAYTLSEFLSLVGQGNPILIRNLLHHSDVVVEIGKRTIILSYEYATKLASGGSVINVTSNIGTLDLGAQFSAEEILTSDSLKYAISQAQVEAVDGTVSIPFYEGEVDERSGNKGGIDTAHKKVHDGHHYVVGHIFTGIGAAASVYLHLKTPDSTTIQHIIFDVRLSKNGTVEFFEDPTLTGDGTSLTIYNNNRRCNNTSSVLAYHTPTVGADGNRLFPGVLGTDGASPQARAHGVMQREEEFMLDRNSNYLVKVTALTADSRASIVTYFYEEIPQ